MNEVDVLFLKTSILLLGVAVYTGKDTKMAKNQKEKTHKFSTVERFVTWI